VGISQGAKIAGWMEGSKDDILKKRRGWRWLSEIGSSKGQTVQTIRSKVVETAELDVRRPPKDEGLG
jgi:hypothetical protein